MDKTVYVITNPEWGWDCVLRVYLASSEEQVARHYIEDNDYLREKYMYQVAVEYNDLNDTEEWVDFEDIDLDLFEDIQIIKELLDQENYIIHEKELNEIN